MLRYTPTNASQSTDAPTRTRYAFTNCACRSEGFTARAVDDDLTFVAGGEVTQTSCSVLQDDPNTLALAAAFPDIKL